MKETVSCTYTHALFSDWQNMHSSTVHDKPSQVCTFLASLHGLLRKQQLQADAVVWVLSVDEWALWLLKLTSNKDGVKESLCSESMMLCVSKCKMKWFLTWGKLLFGMTWETIYKIKIHLKAKQWMPARDFSYKPRQTEKVAIGNTTLTVFFSDLKLWVSIMKF